MKPCSSSGKGAELAHLAMAGIADLNLVKSRVLSLVSGVVTISHDQGLGVCDV